jgi:hypothetical protein
MEVSRAEASEHVFAGMCSKFRPSAEAEPLAFSLQSLEADARTRTGDPFITS